MVRASALLILFGLLSGAWLVAPGAAQAPQPVPEPEPADADEADGVDTLRIPFFASQAPTLDPHSCRDALSFRLVSTVYETLYMYAPGDHVQVVPCLAADWPEISDDGLTHTIKLRAGVPYHNSACFGDDRTRSVTADDVVDSFKRLSVLGDDGMYWMADGLIKGLSQYGSDARYNLQYSTTETAVEGIKSIDDTTVQITLTRPFGALPNMLAHPCFSIMPGEAMDEWGGDLRENAVGTGPYRLNAIANGRIYAFKGVAEHRNGAPAFKRVIFNQRTYWNDFLYGFRDGKFHETPVWQGYWERVVDDDELIGELEGVDGEPVSLDEHGYFFAAFNMEDELWGALDEDGRALRRAVSLAFDRDALLNNAGWDTDWASPQPDLYPVGMEFGGGDDDLGYGKFDLKLAKTTLDGSKYKGGKNPDTGEPLELSMVCAADAFYETVAETLRDGLEELGIDLKVRYSNAFTRGDFSETDEQMFIAGWFLDYPDPVNFLQLFWSKNTGMDKEFVNVPRYQSPGFDKLYSEFEALLPNEANRQRRSGLVKQMGETLAKDQPTIALVRRREAKIRSTKIGWPNLPRQTFNDIRFTKEAQE